jgi:hypothetical protein
MDTVEVRYNQVGIEEPETNKKPDLQFDIYPNPIRDYCFINGRIKNCKIFNKSGRLVTEIKTPYIWQPETNLENGVYFLNVSNRKLIKIILLR